MKSIHPNKKVTIPLTMDVYASSQVLSWPKTFNGVRLSIKSRRLSLPKTQPSMLELGRSLRAVFCSSVVEDSLISLALAFSPHYSLPRPLFSGLLPLANKSAGEISRCFFAACSMPTVLK